MVINFLTEYPIPNSNEEFERDIFKIGLRYLKGNFFMDLLPILPFADIFSEVISNPKYAKLLYAIKLIRLFVVIKLLDHKTNMNQIKQVYHQKMLRIIEKDKSLAESQDHDNIFISRMINISYILKIIQFIIILLFSSYFIGMFWYIFCDYTLVTGEALLKEDDPD